MNINSRIARANFTGYASGAVASFTGLREAPVKIRSYINAIQEGSGDPSPDNIRPISGWSECNVVRCGINIANVSQATEKRYNGSNLYTLVYTDNKIIMETTRTGSLWVIWGFFRVSQEMVGKTISFSLTSNVSASRWVKSPLSDFSDPVTALTNSQSGSYTFTNNDVGSYIGLRFLNGSGADAYIEDVMLNFGSTATSYEAYNGNNYVIQFGDTYYGGSLDVTNGVLTVTHANIASYNGEPINDPWLCSETVYSEGTTPPIGSQVVYPLATPITVQLTPTQIEQLLGANNIFADCGNVEVYYVTI